MATRLIGKRCATASSPLFGNKTTNRYNNPLSCVIGLPKVSLYVSNRKRAVTMNHSPNRDECIQNCLDCHRACLMTVPHLNRAEHASQTHMTSLLLKCAQLCQTSACLMLIHSASYREVCYACAKACAYCAKECYDLANGDAKLLHCADICHRCAKSCTGMAAMAQTM
jgi:hypothetical protein